VLHFIVATNSEARPIIDIFNLKKITEIKEFPIYINKHISLTISGIGKNNCAMAVSQTFCEFDKIKNNVWINIGLAGHKSHKIGEIFIINKIYDSSSKKKEFPHITSFKIQANDCTTFDNENKKYNNSLSDMESSSFFASASQHSTKELIQTIKIISDNKIESINFLNNKSVYDLLIKHKNLLLEFCNHMIAIKDSLSRYPTKVERNYSKLFLKIRLTFNEQNQIKSLLKLYFLKYKYMKRDLINENKNGEYNINKLKKFLNI